MSDSNASRPVTPFNVWSGFSVSLLAVAAIIGVLALLAPTAVGEVWFRIGSHLGQSSPPVMPGFILAGLCVSLLTMALTLISFFPGLAISGGQGFAYLAAARIMGLAAAGATLAFGLARLGVNCWLAVAVPFVLAGIGILVLRHLAQTNRAAWDELRSDLFDFYSVYVLKPVEEDEKRAAEVFSEFMHLPDAKPVIALSFGAPVLLAVAGLVSGALFIQFGFGTIAGIARHWPLISGYFNANSAVAPWDLAPLIKIAPWTLAFIAAWVAYKVLRRTASPLIGHGHPIIISVGMYFFERLHRHAALLVLAHSLLVPAGPPAGLWQPERYALLALLVILGGLAFAAHAGERIVRRAIAVQHAFRARKFWIDNYFILKHFPQPKNPIGYVVLSSQGCVYTAACLLLVLCRMRQLGWALIVTDEWPIKVEKTGQKHIDRFFKMKLGYQNALNFDWNIDWKNKKVEAAGMNFYHPIWEGLSRHFGRYTLDLPEGSEAEGIFKALLTVTDSTLLWAFRISNTVAGYGLPVRVVGASAQFVPNAVWNIFCREIGHKRDMHFVWLQQGYQTYYADKARMSERITLDNMTRKWPYSNPYLPFGADFEGWIKRGQDVPRIVERALNWTKMNRATELKDMLPPARAAMERILAHKAANKPVVCILGKMVFDLSTPWEGGPAHTGMFDWLNHSVEVARKNPDILYIIKPHPYESRPEIAGPVAQFFTDMIEQAIPDNVIILGHTWFNLHALFPHIDLGILWNGTSGLELGLNKVPCMICSEWGPIDYPVGLAHPKDRADYERIMGDPRSVKMPSDYSEKCALLLEYTASDEVMIPYKYSARPITNEPFGPPYWFKDQVRRFIKHGDPHIDAACKRFL